MKKIDAIDTISESDRDVFEHAVWEVHSINRPSSRTARDALLSRVGSYYCDMSINQAWEIHKICLANMRTF